MAAPINPKGSKSDKIWRLALMRAVRRLSTDEPPNNATPLQCLDVMADALVAKGMLGDVPAIKEIGDRLDGRAVQSIEHAGEIQHAYVARMPAPSDSMDAWQKQHANNLTSQNLQ